MYKVGNLVTLKTGQKYDRETELTTEDVGEITDIVNDGLGTRLVVAFQDMIDVEEVTPVCWLRPREVDLYQI